MSDVSYDFRRRCGGSSLFDWIGTVANATSEWDGDDLPDGIVSPSWFDRSAAPRRLDSYGNPVRALGVNGRGKVRFNGLSQRFDSVGFGPLNLIGGAHTSSFMVVVVADLLGVSASNTGTWADTGLWADSSFRLGQGYRRRTTSPDMYTTDGWIYDGAFRNSPADFGAVLGSVRVYHMRKNGTSLYAGVNGVWSSATPVAAAIAATIGSIFRLGSRTDGSGFANADIYKVCSKSNGTDEAAAIAAFVAEYS